MIFEILLGLAIFGAAAAITWAALNGWIAAQKTPSASHAVLVKEHLESGNYRVVAGVFNHGGSRTAHRVWEGKTLDGELEEKFGSGDEVRIYY